jgi:hypothetical protein
VSDDEEMFGKKIMEVQSSFQVDDYTGFKMFDFEKP